MTTFAQIYAKNFTSIVNYITYKGLDADTAQDVAQDVFMKAMRLFEAGSYNPEKSAVSTWLHTIANSAIIDYHRTNQYGKNTTEVSEFADEENGIFFQFKDNNAKTDRRTISREVRARINKAFGKLNENEQVVAYLYFKRSAEYQRIAELTGFPMGTVKGLIFRVREKLQAELSGLSIA